MSRRVLFSVVTPLVYRVWVFSVASFVTEGFVTAGFVMASGQSCGEAPAPYWALALCHIAE